MNNSGQQPLLSLPPTLKNQQVLDFPELHANKLINQSLHIVNLKINRYDMIIGRD